MKTNTKQFRIQNSEFRILKHSQTFRILLLLLLTFSIQNSEFSISYAGIPEPDALIYGQVTNSYGGYKVPVTQGNIQWTIREKDGTATYKFSGLVECVKCNKFENGNCTQCENYLYNLSVPQEAVIALQGMEVPAGVVSLTDKVRQCDYVDVSVNGAPAKIVPRWQSGNEVSKGTAGSYINVGQNRRSPYYRADLEVVSTSVDTDGDGIPDFWEDKYGLNKYDPSDAKQDTDGDGWTNLQEFGKGTNPKISDRIPSLLKNSVLAYEGGFTIFKPEIADSDTSSDALNVKITQIPTGIRLFFHGSSWVTSGYQEGQTLKAGDVLKYSDFTGGNVLLEHTLNAEAASKIGIEMNDTVNPAVSAEILITVYSPSTFDGTDALYWADAYSFAKDAVAGTLDGSYLPDRSGNNSKAGYFNYNGTDAYTDTVTFALNQSPTAKPVISLPGSGFFTLPYAKPVFVKDESLMFSVFKTAGGQDQVIGSGPFWELGITPANHPYHPSEIRVSSDTAATYGKRDNPAGWQMTAVQRKDGKFLIRNKGLSAGGPAASQETTEMGTDPAIGARTSWKYDQDSQSWKFEVNHIMNGFLAEMLVFDRNLPELRKWQIQGYLLSKWFGYKVFDVSDSYTSTELVTNSGAIARRYSALLNQSWYALQNYFNALRSGTGIVEALAAYDSTLPQGHTWTVNPPSANEASMALDSWKFNYQRDYVPSYGRDYSYILIGGFGDDTLIGGFEDDILVGGSGANTLIGNGGKDIFVVSDGDRVMDFSEKDGDVLYIAHLLQNTGKTLDKHLRTEITLDPQNQINKTRLIIDPKGDGTGPFVEVVLENVILRDADLPRLWANGNLDTGGIRPALQVQLTTENVTATEVSGQAAQFKVSFGTGVIPKNFSLPLNIQGANGLGIDYFLETSSYNAQKGIYESVWFTTMMPVSLKPGDTSLLINLIPIEDHITEPSENLVISLVPNADYYDVSGSVQQAVIEDGLNIIRNMAVKDTTVAGSQEYPGKMLITRSGSTDKSLKVNLNIRGTAQNGIDFAYLPSQLIFAPGEIGKQILIQTPKDMLRDKTKVVEILVDTGEGYTADSLASAARVTIQVDFETGDIDNNGGIDLKDAVLSMKIAGGVTVSGAYKGQSITGQIGINDMIYILQKAAGIR